MKATLTLIVFLFAVTAMANTYTVTSNADNGPGTLRDAILQAAANTAGAPNLIVFNIADQSQAGRTITLQSALPALSSNLTIDGTTQPGTPFGISNARVIITNPYTLQYVYYFDMLAVTNVQVYGMYLLGVGAGYAFHFRESSHLQFGAPGKGNIISGFGMVFNCDIVFTTDPFSSDVIIQSNIMGTDPTGMYVDFTTSNSIDFYLINVANLQIGGLKPGEGNLMVEQSYPMDYTWNRMADAGYLNIEGNIQGTDINGNNRLCPNHSNFEINGYNTGSVNVTGTTIVDLNIINNVSVGGYSLVDIGSLFKIKGNHIGVGADNISNLITGTWPGGSNFSLTFDDCIGGLIGGPNAEDKNYIGYNGAAIFEFWCSNITISRNSIFCNGYGITFNWMLNRPRPFININLLTTSMVGGTALPNSTIELFYDDECPGCEGKTYIGNTTADANGNWSYTLTATGAIVATATDTYGATSEFSQATINTNNIVVTNASCGKPNGSIKNIEVTSGTEWYWKDAQGNIIANSTDLTNVGPGTYTFVTSIGGAGCEASSTAYTITNVNLPGFDPNDITITQPSCGQPNGSFQYNGTFDPNTQYSWQNAGNMVVPDFSVTNPLTKLAPGSYTLHLALKTDPSCLANYGPFTLANQTGPVLNTTPVLITPSTCSQNNGSIRGISYQNAKQPVYIGWQDTLGKNINNNLDLDNALAGKYRLAFKDAGACDTIFSNWYTINDNGTMSFDLSKMLINAASCEKQNGSITGIQSTNASTYSWSPIGTINISGTTEDLLQISAGNYQLTMSNALGCQTQTPAITIPQIPKPAIDYTGLQLLNDTCNAGLASIQGLTMVDNTVTYTWSWHSADPVTGNTLDPAIGISAGYLNGLQSGNFKAIVTDKNGCSITSNNFHINNIELNPVSPSATDQYIPRNTATVIKINNAQIGNYKLLDANNQGANVLDASNTGMLHTPILTQDQTFYIFFSRGDCSSPLAPVNIKVFDSVRIYVPNAFTPSNVGFNDHWHIIVRGIIKKIQITVYDRSGTPVFSSEDPNASWDGKFHGKLLSGTYVYTITGLDYYKPFQLKGTLIIIR
jgi:gliding motility-associated-like protein